jgi:hypothetical protein
MTQSLLWLAIEILLQPNNIWGSFDCWCDAESQFPFLSYWIVTWNFQHHLEKNADFVNNPLRTSDGCVQMSWDSTASSTLLHSLWLVPTSWKGANQVQIRFCFIAPRENGLGLFFFVSVDMVQSLLSVWLTVACFWIWLQVNKYYDLVNSFYEYGWGQSYHFANRFLLWSLFSRLKHFVLLHKCFTYTKHKGFYHHQSFSGIPIIISWWSGSWMCTMLATLIRDLWQSIQLTLANVCFSLHLCIKIHGSSNCHSPCLQIIWYTKSYVAW